MTIPGSTLFESRPASSDAATAGLGLIFLGLAVLFGCWVVGTRPEDVGTDTSVYAGFFESLGRGSVQTRMEPGFVMVSYALRRLGLGVFGYQMALFALLMTFCCVAARSYFRYIGGSSGFLAFLSSAVMMLYFSPAFVNAAINVLRQGLAAMLVFAALLSFHRREWWRFAVFGAVASSLHVSSLMYLALAPALLLSTRTLLFVAGGAFLLYASGLSMKLVQDLSPTLYDFVMEYAYNENYRSGVRLDFAAFSIFWYLVPHLVSPLLKEPHRAAIVQSTSVYLVMVLPFFAVGWAAFSNRFLLPAWLSMSIIVAAMIFSNRIAVMRNLLLVSFGLIVSCAALYYYVNNQVVL